MILIAGGTGTLGTQVVQRLTARELPVRVLTRDRARARHLESDLVEIASGDVRDPGAVERATAGASTIISAMHGFAGIDAAGPKAVDQQGNANLIRAARGAGAQHFILLSVHGAAPDHPMELFRMKYRAEEELRASGLVWTIIRPTAYMETWAKMIGEPLLRSGRTVIFGRGRNAINFVSAHDVAEVVERAVTDPSMRGTVVEVGGPENLTFEQVVQTFERVTGRRGTTRHIPLALMRMAATLLGLVRPTLAGQVGAGVVMDTTDFSFDPTEYRRRYPSIPFTSLADVVRRDYGGGRQHEHR